ncbi:MAG: CIA30 family protein [Saprospiraceae bacterium]|nr:CIA30 family protein [Saprospiraceae bacterium]
MKYVLIFMVLGLSASSNMKEIYNFSTQTNIKEWRIVNDDVMGGISKSSILLTDTGHGQFSRSCVIGKQRRFCVYTIKHKNQTD